MIISIEEEINFLIPLPLECTPGPGLWYLCKCSRQFMLQNKIIPPYISFVVLSRQGQKSKQLPGRARRRSTLFMINCSTLRLPKRFVIYLTTSCICIQPHWHIPLSLLDDVVLIKKRNTELFLFWCSHHHRRRILPYGRRNREELKLNNSASGLESNAPAQTLRPAGLN